MTPPLERTDPLPDAVVRYADHPDGLIDLHLPSGEPVGTVLLVHGGFWRSEYDRTHTRPAADALRREGFLVATPEYRRTGATGDRAGGWPTTGDDVRRAARMLPELLTGLGLPVPGTTYAVGHSAGGHLALWLAAEGVPLDRVVALAPVGDLRDAFERDLDDGAVRDLLGGSPDEVPDAYAAADPATRLGTDPGTEVVVLHGTADVQVPIGNSRWTEALPHVGLRVLEDVDHFALMTPGTRAWTEVVAAVRGPATL
ncbi:alpha/beta hydrolase [Nocardioides caldifontis]|uniref:alpha/beta hydrolase n=1 Tax=Nocardioides caldifontis TaxID=2588938 RepID=UPI0011DF401E|nr:alpha/beta hydrolase [Nocardioides caldifontis]